MTGRQNVRPEDVLEKWARMKDVADKLADAGYTMEADLIRAGWETDVMLARLHARAASLPREQAFYGAALVILEEAIERV